MYVSAAIRDFAVAAVGIFEPVYLYRSGFGLDGILLFYAAVYLLFFLALPIGGRICRKHGYEKTILFSSPFLILYYLSLFAIPFHPAFVGVAVVALVLQKILYWPGYHANFATWMDEREEGKEISNRIAITAIATSFSPIFGGALIAVGGFGSLFVTVAALILLANAPLLRTPERFEPRSFPYSEMFRRLFNWKARRRFLSFFGYGEQLFALAAWPVFIAIVVPDLLTLGVIVSLSRLVNVIVTLYAGHLADEGDKKRVVGSGVMFTAASWLIRPFIAGPLGVFLIDSYYRIARNILAVPFSSMFYDHAKRGDVMVRVVFGEMALSLGKLAACLVGIAAVRLFPEHPWPALFVAAGLLSLLYGLIPVDRDAPPAARTQESPAV